MTKKAEICAHCGETKEDVYQCIICFGWFCEKCCEDPLLKEHVLCLDNDTERFEQKAE